MSIYLAVNYESYSDKEATKKAKIGSEFLIKTKSHQGVHQGILHREYVSKEVFKGLLLEAATEKDGMVILYIKDPKMRDMLSIELKIPLHGERSITWCNHQHLYLDEKVGDVVFNAIPLRNAYGKFIFSIETTIPMIQLANSEDFIMNEKLQLEKKQLNETDSFLDRQIFSVLERFELFQRIQNSEPMLIEQIWGVIQRCMLFHEMSSNNRYCLLGYCQLNDGSWLVYEFTHEHYENNKGDYLGDEYHITPILPNALEKWLVHQDSQFPTIDRWHHLSKENAKKIVKMGIGGKHGWKNPYDYSQHFNYWHNDVFLIEALLQISLYGYLKYLKS